MSVNVDDLCRGTLWRNRLVGIGRSTLINFGMESKVDVRLFPEAINVGLVRATKRKFLASDQSSDLNVGYNDLHIFKIRLAFG